MSLPTNPQSRSEEYLNAIATGSTSNLPEPESRMDAYLDYIARNGGGGGGTTVVANPTLAGTEADLTGLQVGDTKYKVPEGGGGGGVFVVTVDDDTGALDKTWREIYTAAQSSVVILLGSDPDNPGTINTNYFNSARVGTGLETGYYYVLFGDLTGELFELRANSADGYPAFYD